MGTGVRSNDLALEYTKKIENFAEIGEECAIVEFSIESYALRRKLHKVAERYSLFC
jgi:hypothetical protein